MTTETILPTELKFAMRARDEAFYAVDPIQWGKYTDTDFSTVQQNGAKYTRENRIENLKTQSVRPYVARQHEQYHSDGDLVATRFYSGGLWVIEIWKCTDGNWKTVMTQATTADSKI